MAIKTIKFRQISDDVESAADGADGVYHGTATDRGEYPQTISGVTSGWSPNNNSGITTFAGVHGAAAPFQFSTAIVGPGGPERLLRIDRAAGTFTIKAQVYMPDGTYASTALRILDSDGTTPLWTQTVVTRTTDGVGAARQINTDNSMVTVGSADAGQSITTTGAAFYVGLVGTGSFNTRLTYFEWDDGVGGGGSVAAVIRRRRSLI